MSSRENIVGRVAKLLALAADGSGGTPAERNAAAERAAALMAKHRVEQAELDAAGKGDGSPVDQHGPWTLSRRQFHEAHLWDAIGRTVGVDTVYVTGRSFRTYYLVGRLESVQYVRTLAEWILPQLNRECEVELAAHRAIRAGAGYPTMTSAEVAEWRRSFYVGANLTLGQRLEAATKAATDAASAGTDLVLSDRRALDDFYGDDAPKFTEDESARAKDVDAAMTGIERAGRLDLNPGNKLRGDRLELGA